MNKLNFKRIVIFIFSMIVFIGCIGSCEKYMKNYGKKTEKVNSTIYWETVRNSSLCIDTISLNKEIIEDSVEVIKYNIYPYSLKGEEYYYVLNIADFYIKKLLEKTGFESSSYKRIKGFASQTSLHTRCVGVYFKYQKLDNTYELLNAVFIFNDKNEVLEFNLI